jgi:excisionase family DNA binding protein
VEPLLTIADAAAVLKMSKRQVQRLMRARVLPFVSIGRTVRIRQRDLESFIESRVVGPWTTAA